MNLDHRVIVLPPRAVGPLVLRNETGAAGVLAIWTGARQPGLKAVAIKTPPQQSILALHRLRSRLLKMRIMQSNALRGLLYEFGVILPESYRAMRQQLPTHWADLGRELPALLLASLRGHWARVDELNGQIAALDRRLERICEQDPHCEALSAIPGVGVLTDTAPLAATGDPRSFRSLPSSPHGSILCHDRPASAGASANPGSPNEATPTCVRCRRMRRAPSSCVNRTRHGSARS